MNYTEKYKVSDVPEGQSGDWKIRRFVVNDKHDRVMQLSDMFHTGRYVPAGTYTGLYRKTNSWGGDQAYRVVMSDTPDEIWDMIDPIIHAEGKVLIVGLGLGVVLNAAAMHEDVTHIDIVEKSGDVLKLVQEHYEGKFPGKLNFIQIDIHDFRPQKGTHWDYIWFDIWDDICTDNLAEMAKLARRFGRLATRKGYWGKDVALAERRRSRNDPFVRYMRARQAEQKKLQVVVGGEKFSTPGESDQ